MNNKLLYVILFLGTIFLFTFYGSKKNHLKKIYISKVVEHPALNATVQGIIDELEVAGYKNNQTCHICVESAQGQVALASQIAAQFCNQWPDVVVGVGTLSAQSFLRHSMNAKIPLVFSSVTDPEAAGFTKCKEVKVCGVSNFISLEPQLELFKKIQPRLKKLALLYNPAELNSVKILNQLEKLCPLYNIQLVAQTLTSTSEAMQAAVYVSTQADALFISNDNTALAALSTVIQVANKAKIPVYVSDTDAVQLGALAALGPNQYEIGRQTGRLIAKILAKQECDANVEYPNKVELYLNREAASALSIEVPAEVVQQAHSLVS